MPRRNIVAWIALIAAIHVGASAAWMYTNGFFSPSRPPFHDCAYFRLDALEIQKEIDRSGFTGWLKGGYRHDRPHPPILAMLNAAAGIPLDRLDTMTQWCVQAVYLAGLVVALYLLGREVLGTPGRALFFSALASAAPVYIASARVALPKFPMMVMVFFALHALLRSSLFSKRGWSLAFGIWAGIAVMTMMLAPIYMIGSAGTAFLIGLSRGPKRPILINAGIAILAMLAIAATWYPNHWERVLGYAAEVTSLGGQKFWSRGVGMWNIERWVYYPAFLVNNGLGFFPAAAVVLAAVLWMGAWCLRATARPAERSMRSRNGVVLAVGALGSLLIVARGQIAAESQYIMNLPALLLLMAHWCVYSLRWRGLRVAALAILAAASLVSAAFTFRSVDDDVTPQPEDHWSVPIVGGIRLRVIAPMDTYGGSQARELGVRTRPEAEDWPFDEVVGLMETHRASDEIRLGQVKGAASAYMNEGNILYVARQRGNRISIVGPSGFPPYTQVAIDAFAREAEFLVVDPVFMKRNAAFVGSVAMRTTLSQLEVAGAKLTKLLERQVTSRSSVVLYKISHPDRTLDVVSELPAGTSQVAATFDNGWSLRGLLHQLDQASDAVTVTSYWDNQPDAQAGFQVLLRVQTPGRGGEWTTLGDSRRDLVKLRGTVPPGHLLALRSTPLQFPKGARLLLVMPRRDGSGRPGESGSATRSTLPDCGPFTLIVLLRAENGEVQVARPK